MAARRAAVVVLPVARGPVTKIAGSSPTQLVEERVDGASQVVHRLRLPLCRISEYHSDAAVDATLPQSGRVIAGQPRGRSTDERAGGACAQLPVGAPEAPHHVPDRPEYGWYATVFGWLAPFYLGGAGDALFAGSMANL